MTGRQAKSAMCLIISQHDAFPSAAADEQSDGCCHNDGLSVLSHAFRLPNFRCLLGSISAHPIALASFYRLL